MKNLFVYTLLVMCTLLMTYTVQADRTSDLSAYPQKDYLVGVWEGMNVAEAALKARAETQLTEKVFDNVKTIIESNRTNKEAYDQVWEHYGLVLQGTENAKLTGLNTKSGASYVIVYTKRSDLQSAYAQQESALRNRINGIIARAQAANNSGELDTAAKAFMSSYPLYEELKEAELIQLGAKYTPSSDAFANLHAAAVGTDKGTLTMSHKEVIKHVNQLDQQPIYNLDTIAGSTANQFRQQDSPSMGKVQKGSIQYGSKRSSPHASGTAAAIAEKLGWSLVPAMRALKKVERTPGSGGTPSSPGSGGTPSSPGSGGTPSSPGSGGTPSSPGSTGTPSSPGSTGTPSSPGSTGTPSSPLKIYGTYWENGDRITLRTALRDVTTGKFKASAVVQFLESQRQDGHIPIKPTGYDVAEEDDEPYDDNTNSGTSQIETKTITSGGLAVTIDTDRGPGPITLTEGEIVTLYVSVNQEAYLQLIYVLQDGRKILLMDNNYHIDTSKAGTVVEIGQFECAPPFGIEELYVYAQPTPFPEFKPGETYEKDGFVFLTKTRALRRVRPTGVLSITTAPVAGQ